MDSERKQNGKKRLYSSKRSKPTLDSHGSSEDSDVDHAREQSPFKAEVKKEPLEPGTTVSDSISVDTSLVVTSSSEAASPPPVAAPSASASPPPASTPLTSSMPPPALEFMLRVSPPLLAPHKIPTAPTLTAFEPEPTTKRKRGRPRMYDKSPIGTIATRPVAIAPAPLPAMSAPLSSIVVPGGPRRKWTKVVKHTTKTALPLAAAPSVLPTVTVPPPSQSLPQLHSPHHHHHHHSHRPPPTPEYSPFLPSPSHTAEIPLRPTIIPTYVASTTHALVSPVTSPHPITHTLLLIDADLYPDLVSFLDRPVPGTQSFIFASPRSRPALVAHPPLFPPPTYATLFRTSRDVENAAGFELVRHAFQWLYAGLVAGKKVYVCGDEGGVGNLVEVLREHRIVAEGVKPEAIKEIIGGRM